MSETAKRTARVPILGENGRISDDYVPAAIGEGVESAEAAATRAETAATGAEGSAAAASQSAAGAQGSASAASTSATQARESATAATGAATSAQSAQTAAEAAKTAAEMAQSAAAGSAQDAQQSATAAASSAASVADKFIASAQATTLEPGSQATASVEEQVLTIGVPKGEKGDTPTIGIGTVETLPAGSSATASATATDTGVNINFGIPKGDSGEVSAVQAAEGSDLSVSTDEGTVTIDDSALRTRIAELENQAANVVTGTVTDLVAHGEDAYAQKPREIRIKGKTWVNRWPVLSNTNGGITVSTDETGLITVTGTATGDSYVYAIVNGVRAGASVTCKLSISPPTDNTWTPYIEIVDDEGAYIKSGSLNGSTVIPFNAADIRCGVHVYVGQAVNTSFRVMLVDGTEAPDCFTPPASIASVETGKLVTSGKNLLPEDPFSINNTYLDCGVLPPGDYVLSFENDTAWWETAPNGNRIYTAPAYTTGIPSILMGNTAIGQRAYGTFTNPHTQCVVFTDFSDGIFVNQSDFMVELGSTATSYEPPTVTETPLPEVELRSLPNGTCDELVIKADGTCEIERETGTFTFNGSENWAKEASSGISYFSCKFAGTDERTPSGRWGGYNDRLPTENPHTYSGDCFYIFANGNGYNARIRKSGCDDVASIKEWIASNNVHTVYETVDSTEPQSPVTLPQLPAPTFNVYHDSQVPSDTTVTYARDINIVIANLEAVQTALLGGE